MLIPLVGLAIGCAIFACIGMLALTLLPKLRPTPVNVAMFVLGAVPTSAVSALAYGQVFGNEAGELNPLAVLGLFALLLVAGVCGGLLCVFSYKWLTRVMPWHRDSGGV